MDVRLPDGTIITNVPEGITQKELIARLEKMREPEAPKAFLPEGERPEFGLEEIGQLARRGAGFIEEQVQKVLPRFIGDPLEKAGTALEQQLATRQREVAETQQSLAEGKIGPTQAAIQYIGKGVAGPALDLVGGAAMMPIRAAVEATPEEIKAPVGRTFSAMWDQFSQSEIGRIGIKAFQSKVEEWGAFKKSNPEEAKTIEAAANIGLVVAPVKKSTISGRASKMEMRATGQLARRKADYVDELILPKETPLVRKEMAKRAKEIGLLRKRVVNLTPNQKRMSREVQLIKGVNPKRSMTHNGWVIRKEVSRQANDLAKDLMKSRVRLSNDAVKTNIRSAIDKLKAEHPIIGSEAGLRNMADIVERNAHRILAGFPQTPHGVLQARRQFDSWIRKFNKTVHDRGEKTGPLKEVVASIRQAMNDSIHKVVPSKSVKHRLNKQSLLLRSLDNIDGKMFGEGGNAVIRAIDRIMNIPQARNKIVGVGGTLLGMGIVGGSAMLSGPIAWGMGLTGITVMGGRYIVSPTAKKALAKLLRGIDFTLRTKQNPSVIRQLRADRAIIADMIKNSETVEE
jgi:hypothetical protein